MNKNIISALVLAGMIMGSNAFASQAREGVMGTGGNSINAGSFYYDSAYNIFYNPVYINDMKNYVIFEKDATGSGFVGTAASMHGFNWAVYMNRANAFGSTTASTAGSALGTSAYATRPIDFVIGGDQGVKWGLGITYASNNVTASDKKSTDMDMRAGISMNGFDPWVGFHVTGKNGAAENKNKGFNAGLRYHYGEWTPYAMYSNKKWEPTGGNTKNNTWLVGLGRESKLGDAARLMYALYYYKSKTESSDTTATARKDGGLPVNVSVEADATSWLTLRAGFIHTLIGPNNNAAADTTTRVGGTFHMGKVDTDFVFGETGGTVDSNSVGFDKGTFTQVSVRYSW